MSDSFGLLKQLDEKELLIYNAEVAKVRKSTGVAYLLWFFFGGLGAHKFYLGEGGMGVLYIMMTIGWLCGFGFPPLLLIAFILGIMLFIDLFTIPGQVKKHQDREGSQIAQRLLSSRI